MTICVAVILFSFFSASVHSATPILKTTDRNLNWRIVGGSDAPDGMYPYQVSIRHTQLGANVDSYYTISETDCTTNLFQPFSNTISSGYHTCGGSIISPDYILTAAHCVSYESPSDFYVVIGSNKLNSGGVIYAVTDLHWHKDFSIWHGQNDIALLKLSPGIVFTKQITPVLLQIEEVNEKEVVVLSGWGSTDYPGAIPDSLQHISLETVSNAYCDSLHQLSISSSQLCTSTETGRGACKGDSGGPLVKKYSDGKVRQAGIVSFGRSCAEGYPDVYTKVSSFLSWIKDKCNHCI